MHQITTCSTQYSSMFLCLHVAVMWWPKTFSSSLKSYQVVCSPLLGGGFTKDVKYMYLCVVRSRRTLSFLIAEPTITTVCIIILLFLVWNVVIVTLLCLIRLSSSSESRPHVNVALVACVVGRRSKSLSVSSSSLGYTVLVCSSDYASTNTKNLQIAQPAKQNPNLQNSSTIIAQTQQWLKSISNTLCSFNVCLIVTSYYTAMWCVCYYSGLAKLLWSWYKTIFFFTVLIQDMVACTTKCKCGFLHYHEALARTCTEFSS